MTSEQLRSIFHVESQDLVPNYEVINLMHHGLSEHRISKRSINVSPSFISRSNNQFEDLNAKRKLSSHHVKKDLSKSAYYSELKKESTLPVLSEWSVPKFTNSVESELEHISGYSNSNSDSDSFSNQSKLVKKISSDSTFDMQNESLHMQGNKHGDGDIYEQTKHNQFVQFDLANIKEHNVSLSLFGQSFNLTLRPTKKLFKNGTQSLRMFTVNATPNATYGLSYEPIEEVSFLKHSAYPISFHYFTNFNYNYNIIH